MILVVDIIVSAGTHHLSNGERPIIEARGLCYPLRIRYKVKVGAPPPWDPDEDGDDPWGDDGHISKWHIVLV